MGHKYKLASIGSTLDPADYRREFSFLKKAKNKRYKPENDELMSIHSACFLQAAVIQSKIALAMRYGHDIPFMLDAGCPDRACIDKAHAYLKEEFPHEFVFEDGSQVKTYAGGITWEDDTKFSALQAADVVAWAVRRKASGKSFSGGTEPLEGILVDRHADQHYAGASIQESAANLRARLGI